LLVRIAQSRGYFLDKVTFTNVQKNKTRDVLVPLCADGVTNPAVKVSPPAPGVVIYRLEESYLYPNCSIDNSALVDYVKENMRRDIDVSTIRLEDRPWNDSGPASGDAEEAQAENLAKLQLRGIILDFSAV
jgi:solute carrier family 26 (sodium-independent sulfate anion transporter), member 11